jgi:tagatose kinase
VRVDREAVTGVAFVAYDESGGREFVFHVADAAPPRICFENLGSEPERADWMHVSGSSLALSESMAQTILAAAERVLDAGGCVSFDPNLRVGSAGAAAAPTRRFEFLLGAASLLFPSEGELKPFGLDDAALARRGIVVCETLGRDGARLHCGGAVTEIPGIAMEEVDPTGAGDTFSGSGHAQPVRRYRRRPLNPSARGGRCAYGMGGAAPQFRKGLRSSACPYSP